MTPTKLDRKLLLEAVEQADDYSMEISSVNLLVELARAYLDNSLSERPMMTEEQIFELVLTQTSANGNIARRTAQLLTGHILAPEKVCPVHKDTRCYCDPRPNFFEKGKEK
jgi:hypothetical protein